MPNTEIVRKLIEADKIVPALAKADTIICMSEILEECCRMVGINTTLKVLGNRLYPDNFYPTRRKSHEMKIRLLFVGRLVEQKNIHGIVSALTILKERGYSVHLDICGGNFMNSYLWECVSKLEQKEWKYHGSVANNRLNKLYNSADMYIGPSTFEGFQIPLIEALATGTPCIASDIPPASTIIDAQIGELVDPLVPESIANGIEKLKKRLNSPVQYKLIFASCIARSKKYDYFKISLNEAHIYLDLLENDNVQESKKDH